MLEFFEGILAVISKIIDSLGYLGVALGMFFESACIPIPSELVLPLAGKMANSHVITLVGANIAAAAGSLLGSFTAYAVGYFGGRPFIFKYGKYFFVSRDHFEKAERTFNRFGGAAVFFGRLLPVIRTFISLPAGIARMDKKKFAIYSLIGMLPWNAVLIYLGFLFGQSYDTKIRPYFKKFEHVIFALIALAIVALIVKAFHSKRLRNK